MPLDDWKPRCSPEMLHARARLSRVLREFFGEHGYLEVDTPLLSHDIVVDTHLDPLTSVVGRETLYLQTSPEAAMKRLLAAGIGNIYQITRSFRAGERGSLHNPEFTIVEWYGVGSNWKQQIDFTEALVRQTLPEDSALLPSDERFRVTTYQETFQKHLGIDALAISMDELHECFVECTGSTAAPATDRDDLLNLVLAEKIEPHLGIDHPEFLVNFPASQAALAQLSDEDERVARRFELYIDGIEICNGYQELTDPEKLRTRDALANQRRQSRRAEMLPGARRMLAGMDFGLPSCSGVALGFDRLLMVLTGAGRIDDVLPFPVERA